MRFFNIFVIIAAICAVAFAAPNVAEDEIEPRVSCDVIGGEWGDRACAVHCIGLGHSGGWCDGQKVCNCR